MSDAQITHSTDCWQWHHECAKRIVMELRAENERLRSELGVANDCIDLLRQDAERYWWMRSQNDWRYQTYPGSPWACHWTSGLDSEQVDAAIDAARAAGGEK